MSERLKTDRQAYKKNARETWRERGGKNERERERLSHLSIHQWVRFAIHAVLLVYYYGYYGDDNDDVMMMMIIIIIMMMMMVMMMVMMMLMMMMMVMVMMK